MNAYHLEQRHAQRRLTVVWFTGTTVLFLLNLAITLSEAYGDSVGEAWGWLLPSVLPTASLMLGVFVTEALKRNRTTRHVDRFTYHLCFALSVFYLMMVLLVLLWQPFDPAIMRTSNYWLGPLQGLVSLALGAFFVRETADPKTAGDKQGPRSKTHRTDERVRRPG